jgi:hypothetical protein
MRKLLSTLMLTLAAATLSVHAADEKKPTAQQEKMKACNAEAAGMKGDERKAFMSKCLSATRQEKMTKCNKDAGDKKGDERKAFMSQCLKG